MEKLHMEEFLVKSTIPRVKNKDERLWDAVWRAHRDVLTGRNWLKNYCQKVNKEGINEVVQKLYEIIKEGNEELTSENLINILKQNFEVEFGAIQKLVNMTLKYIIILNAYKELKITVQEEKCDCPLDSVILQKVGAKYSNWKWTSMNENEYTEVQKEIRSQLDAEHLQEYGNVFFDFSNW